MQIKKLFSTLCATAMTFALAGSIPANAGSISGSSVDSCEYVFDVNQTITTDAGVTVDLSSLPSGTAVGAIYVQTTQADSATQANVAIGMTAAGLDYEYDWYSDSALGTGEQLTFLYEIPDEVAMLYGSSYTNMQVQLWWSTDESVTVNKVGITTISDTDSETPVPTKKGDLNGDKQTTVVDAVILTKHLTQIEMLSATYSTAADMNDDSAVDAFDLAILKRNLIAQASAPVTETALEFVSNLSIGWSLGNTLDSTVTWTENPTVNQFETGWGCPTTTKAMIDAIKDAGFNTVRIPVSWGQKMGSAPDYTVDTAWMDRVQEVVDYVIDNDMYCILNVHHDNDWLIPKYESQAAATAQLTKLWEQISARFASYDTHLIFEAMNEPRLVGDATEWSGGTYEARDCINQYNAAALATIRAAGGNNANRYVMLPTYAASGITTTINDFVLPDDDKIIVSIHSYSPYSFALDTSGTSSWSGSDYEKNELNNIFKYLYDSFVAKGTPVIIGEFGALNKDNIEDRVRWAEYYISTAKSYGLVCVWWDNNAFNGSGENFGLFNRNTMSIEYPTLLAALMAGLES